MSNIVDRRIPVTIITGFLGAGKTTFLNSLISRYPMKKFAIIENEFGEINIDSDLVVGVDTNNIFELSNGCICCSLNEDLYKVLNRLLKSEKPFNHLLIETTGIADPSSVILPFIADIDIQTYFRIDGVVCLVDSVVVEDVLTDAPESACQIALADFVILNKKSEVTPDYLQSVRDTVNKLNENAIRIETDFADVSKHDVLNLQAYQPEKVEDMVKTISNEQRHHNVIHGTAIRSHSFILKGEMNYDRFSLFMDYFLTFNQHSIYRIKGVMSFQGSPCRMIAQSVKTMFLMTEGRDWENNETKESRIVFIGKNLEKEIIRNNLESMIMR